MNKQEGDGSWQRKIDEGRCPNCGTNMSFTSDGFETDYAECTVCSLTVITRPPAELDIVVELE